MVKKGKVHDASAPTPKRLLDTSSLIREPAGKTDRLFVTIRDLALQQQKDSPQVFLSLRDAARRFEVPISTMADIFRGLKEEGILSSIRGSRTMLRGRGGRRTLQVAGLIGMPLSVRRLMSLDYRRCFLEVRDALLRHQFIISPFFFEQGEADPPALVQRLKREKVDAALWFLPDGADRETAARLGDAGISFIGVSLGELSGRSFRYEVRRDRALKAILREWRGDPALERVVVVRAADEGAGDAKRVPEIRALVEAERFRCEVGTLPDRGVSAFLKSLCAENRAVILPDPAAAVLGWRGTEAAVEVLRACRVALLDGPLELLPAGISGREEVDVVTADWEPIAKRIADEVLDGAALAEGATTTFQARHHLGVPLAGQGQL